MTGDSHRAWRKYATVAVTAIAALAIGVVVGRLSASGEIPPHPPLPTPSSAPPPPGAVVRSATDLNTSVRLTAVVTPEQGLIRLRATVVGAQPGREYRIVVNPRSGAPVTAATWVGTPEQMLDSVSLDGTVAIALADLVSVDVVGADGQRYTSVEF